MGVGTGAEARSQPGGWEGSSRAGLRIPQIAHEELLVCLGQRGGRRKRLLQLFEQCDKTGLHIPAAPTGRVTCPGHTKLTPFSSWRLQDKMG